MPRVTGRAKRPKLLKPLEDIWLFGEITDANALGIVLQLEACRKADRPARLWICSMGGDLGGALAIHDALKCVPNSEAIATGNCQSAALVAFLGARTRFATPNTIFMNHNIEGQQGEGWPVRMELPAIERLKEIRSGTFGPELAKDLGVVMFMFCLTEGAGQSKAAGA